MTFRTLLDRLLSFIKDHPDHEALDEHVVIRVQTSEINGDDLHAGGLRDITVDAGCTDTYALVLDADQEPDEPDESDAKQQTALPARDETTDSSNALITGMQREELAVVMCALREHSDPEVRKHSIRLSRIVVALYNQLIS